MHNALLLDKVVVKSVNNCTYSYIMRINRNLPIKPQKLKNAVSCKNSLAHLLGTFSSPIWNTQTWQNHGHVLWPYLNHTTQKLALGLSPKHWLSWVSAPWLIFCGSNVSTKFHTTACASAVPVDRLKSGSKRFCRVPSTAIVSAILCSKSC